jgi:hypothetical protein
MLFQFGISLARLPRLLFLAFQLGLHQGFQRYLYLEVCLGLLVHHQDFLHCLCLEEVQQLEYPMELLVSQLAQSVPQSKLMESQRCPYLVHLALLGQLE